MDRFDSSFDSSFDSIDVRYYGVTGGLEDYRMAYVFANYGGCLDYYTRCPKDTPSHRYFLYHIKNMREPMDWFRAPVSAWEGRGYVDQRGWVDGPMASI